ncbi:methyltransferase domain-containing protein [Undibacterium sp. Jales W-56]|uniref:methyltransferase domain-containing protein n=1 Tax=Undibacterium sp. Jales W-56 TaxID=2897325 RepID=UPI0021D03361|nr:methyltransferase domain-containing protein [Undibacterium sp. Jales W-56]MCU6435032.1 methyltransferase domain-containing protein [Undibacterium sp. Jales W-56]
MLSAPIDLSRVRQLFSQPKKVAGSDFLRREVALRMREKLELVKIQPGRLLDAGCGAAADLMHMQGLYPHAQLFGVDASHQMLQVARQSRDAAQSSVGRLLNKWLPTGLRAVAADNLICADFARLPIATNSLDMVWSNLALHWHPQPDLVFAEWRRVLRTEGLLMFSCFGPDTLVELRRAFADIDALPHTLPFVDMHDFGDMLVNAGFSTPVMDMEKITLTYQSVEQLFADVKSLGGNPLLTRRQGLLGRAAHQRLCDALLRTRGADGRIPLTLEVVYGHAFRPILKKLASGESIIRLDFPKK